MSDYVYPALQGLAYDAVAELQSDVLIQRSIGGSEARAARYANLIGGWSLTYSFLDKNDLEDIRDFFEARWGAYDDFLFSHTGDTQAVQLLIGYGTGAEQHFQIDRMSTIKPVGAAYVTNASMPVPLVYLDGVLRTTGYSISTADLITFSAPLPAGGVEVSWSGDLYHRVRFSMDMMDLSEFMHQLWELKQVDLVSVR